MVKRIALVVGLVAASVLFSGGVASAGGPTSVLVSSPANERTTAMRYSDPAYDRLDGLIHGRTPIPAPAAPGGSVVTATWLIHDVQVWRIDRIYLQTPGGPLVSTQNLMTADPPPPDGAPTVWSRLGDAGELRALLVELGILGPTPPTRPLASDPAGTTSIQPAAPAPAAPAADPATGWWWGAAGLVGGAVGTLLITRRRPGAAAAPDEPALVVQDRA